MKQLSSALIVSLCLLIMTGTAAAQRLHGAITQWDTAGFRAYDVTATTDGYLWFTHTSAVVRFDPSSGANLTADAPSPPTRTFLSPRSITSFTGASASPGSRRPA